MKTAFVLAGALLLAATSQAQILITQVVDGDLAGGTPKVIELTNIGASAAPLANLQVQFAFNGAATLGNAVTLTTALTPLTELSAGQSVTIVPTGSDDEFLAITGFAPSFVGGSSVNGNDVVALVNSATTTVIDQFGTLGSATDFYLDSSAVRNQSITAPNATYTSSEWTITSVDTLDLNGHIAAIGSGATGNNRLGFHQAGAAPASADAWNLYQ
ncbi:MAG: lamin tail domain-containing protein [Candidatus Sumerlaeia bacterium]|nr:lamin tail domain-containing protein [Candidatus Sumerlaeia bacterium]